MLTVVTVVIPDNSYYIKSDALTDTGSEYGLGGGAGFGSGRKFSLFLKRSTDTGVF